MTVLKAILAVDQDGHIGRQGALPWHLPNDLAWFRHLTLNRPVIMGRRTWESLKGPLPQRLNIVASKSLSAETPGCRVARTISDALALVQGEEEAFVIGGGEIYRASYPWLDAIYLTVVHAAVGGDTRADIDDWAGNDGWESVRLAYHPADPDNVYAVSFWYMQPPNRPGILPVWNGGKSGSAWSAESPNP